MTMSSPIQMPALPPKPAIRTNDLTQAVSLKAGHPLNTEVMMNVFALSLDDVHSAATSSEKFDPFDSIASILVAAEGPKGIVASAPHNLAGRVTEKGGPG